MILPRLSLEPCREIHPMSHRSILLSILLLASILAAAPAVAAAPNVAAALDRIAKLGGTVEYGPSKMALIKPWWPSISIRGRRPTPICNC